MLREAVETGDMRAALGCTWRLYYPGLKRLALAVGVPPPEVDDALQEGMARVAAEWHAFRGPAFVPWVFTVVRYECLTRRQGLCRARARQVDAARETNFPAVGTQAALEIDLAIRAVLAGLDPVSMMIFEALDTGMTDRELAEAIERELGEHLGERAIQGRRYRLRASIAAALGLRGEG